MKTIIRNTLSILLTLSSSAFAAGTTGSGEAGLPVVLLLGFFALMIAFQMVPATMMMIGLGRGLFARKVDPPR